MKFLKKQAENKKKSDSQKVRGSEGHGYSVSGHAGIVGVFRLINHGKPQHIAP